MFHNIKIIENFLSAQVTKFIKCYWRLKKKQRKNIDINSCNVIIPFSGFLQWRKKSEITEEERGGKTRENMEWIMSD